MLPNLLLQKAGPLACQRRRLETFAAGRKCMIQSVLGFALASWTIQSNAQPYGFSTVAGLAGQRITTDGTNSGARFYWPRCLAINSGGNFFVTDDTTVRQITVLGTNWIVRTIAGLPRTSGATDGTNSTARFQTPSGIAVDAATNVYVADYGNHTIRKLTPAGTNWVVTTVAGLADHAGRADGTNGNARFSNPFGLVLNDAGDLFVADSGNDTIRKISQEGTNWNVTTITGSSTNSGSADGTNFFARFNQPRDIALEASGILYVTDRLNGTVRKIMALGTNWIVTTIAGLAGQRTTLDGTGSAARFSGPDGIALDNSGVLYVTDTVDNNIRELTPVGTNWVVSTIGGAAGTGGSADGTGTNAFFNYPDNIKVGLSGQLYITDRDNYTIRKGVLVVAPSLDISWAGNQVFLSWPVSEAAFVLETSSLLPAGSSWTPVTNPAISSLGRWLVTNDSSGVSSFYRLRHVAH